MQPLQTGRIMGNYINLKKLNYDELAGVVNLYPWYGGARKELCVRMFKMGEDAWDKSQYGDAALYVGDRSKIADIVRKKNSETDYSDKDIDKLVKTYINSNQSVTSDEDARPVRVVGGDFFSQSQYDRVRREDDNVFSRFAVKAVRDSADGDSLKDLSDDFCTETLARIYEEQGYYEQARHIYSRLLLKFPEKNAYFASLIEKLDNQEDELL